MSPPVVRMTGPRHTIQNTIHTKILVIGLLLSSPSYIYVFVGIYQHIRYSTSYILYSHQLHFTTPSSLILPLPNLIIIFTIAANNIIPIITTTHQSQNFCNSFSSTITTSPQSTDPDYKQSKMPTTCLRRPPIRNVPLSISGLIAGAAAAAAGVILGQISSATVTPPQQSCESCGGEGYIDCLCARWNYAAATSDRPPPTCDTCRGSRRQRCPRCRGGGTKIPLLKQVPIPVRIREPLQDIFNRTVLLPLFALPIFRISPRNSVGRLVVNTDLERVVEQQRCTVRL